MRALNHISLDIGEKEFVAIIGQSGSGKSTLMNMLGCLDVPTSGSYRLHGKDVAEMIDDELSDIRNKEIGFIFQGFNLISSLTALENVELPLIYRGLPKRERSELAKEALRKVGLEMRMSHKPSEMSGGQQQRVAIARAIAQAPPIILADEPTGNLDSHSSVEILEILKQLHEEGRTVIIITHDPGIAAKASRIVHIMDGQIYKDELNTGEDESAIRAELAKAQENVTTKVKSVRHHEEDDLVIESYEEAPVQEKLADGDFTEDEELYEEELFEEELYEEDEEHISGDTQTEESTEYMGTESDPNKEES